MAPDSLTIPITNLNNNSASFTWSKSFTNGSGGNVTVAEVGAYMSTNNVATLLHILFYMICYLRQLRLQILRCLQ